MSSTEADDEDQKARLKSALWYSITQIVDSETLRMRNNASPQFIGALTEMVWVQIETIAQDLENFAKHAHRSTINTSDVLLLARRNEGLEAVLRNFIDTRLNTPTTTSSRIRR